MQYFSRMTYCFIILIFSTSFVTNIYALEVLSLGDSITQGLQRTASKVIYGITNPVNGAANIGGYQPYLNHSLNYYIEPSAVYNWGIAGETSKGGLARIQSVLNSRSADYILILYGANDLNSGISASTTQANIRSMVEISRNANVIPIISEITPYNLHTTRIENQYNPLLNELSLEEGVTIVPMYQKMIQNWNSIPYHSGDGLHLSTEGNNFMGALWFNTIQDINGTHNIVPILQLLLL